MRGGASLPVLLREVLDELQHGAICHQVQRALALVIGVVDVCPLLCQEARDGHTHVELHVAQQS